MRHSNTLRFLVLLGSIAAVLVWALPLVLRVGPSVCARWQLTTGICSGRVRAALTAVDAWTERYLRPLTRSARVQRTLQEATRGLDIIEASARKGLGDQRVDAALRGVDAALQEAEALVRDQQGREKIADIPENAQRLIAEATSALAELRAALFSSERRVEDVARSLGTLRAALDALSGIVAASPSPSVSASEAER